MVKSQYLYFIVTIYNVMMIQTSMCLGINGFGIKLHNIIYFKIVRVDIFRTMKNFKVLNILRLLNISRSIPGFSFFFMMVTSYLFIVYLRIHSILLIKMMF